MKPRTEKPLRLDPNEAPKGYRAMAAGRQRAKERRAAI